MAPIQLPRASAVGVTNSTRASAGAAGTATTATAVMDEAEILRAAEMDSLRCELVRMKEAHAREIEELRSTLGNASNVPDLVQTVSALRAELMHARATIASLQTGKPSGACLHCDAFQKTIAKLNAQVATLTQSKEDLTQAAAEAINGSAMSYASSHLGSPVLRVMDSPAPVHHGDVFSVSDNTSIDLASNSSSIMNVSIESAITAAELVLGDNVELASIRETTPETSRQAVDEVATPTTEALARAKAMVEQRKLELQRIQDERNAKKEALRMRREKLSKQRQDRLARASGEAENRPSPTASPIPERIMVAPLNTSIEADPNTSTDSYTAAFPPIEAYKPSNPKGAPIKPILKTSGADDSTRTTPRSVQFSSSPPPVVVVPRKPTPELVDSSDSDDDEDDYDSILDAPTGLFPLAM